MTTSISKEQSKALAAGFFDNINSMKENSIRVKQWHKQQFRKALPPKPDSFKRTEGNVQYAYDVSIDDLYQHWSADKRYYGFTHTFTDFYNKLTTEQKSLVTIKQIV